MLYLSTPSLKVSAVSVVLSAKQVLFLSVSPNSSQYWLLTCSCLHLQASIVDVLQSDLAKIESLVRDAMRQLSSAATSSSVRPLDACEVMEAMNRHHLQELLPRLEQADTSFEQLCAHCLDCKVCFAKFQARCTLDMLGVSFISGSGCPYMSSSCCRSWSKPTAPLSCSVATAWTARYALLSHMSNIGLNSYASSSCYRG